MMGMKKLGNVLLFHTLVCSTIGDEELNFWVRYGIRCTPFSIVTKKVVWYNLLSIVNAWRYSYTLLAFIIIDIVNSYAKYADEEKKWLSQWTD